MDAEKWKDAARKAFSKDRTVKFLVLLGICGIVLIFFSGLFGKSGSQQEPLQEETSPANAEEYRRGVEQDISRIVEAITGEEKPAVLVTLESGSRYIYAEDEKNSSGTDGEKKSEEEEKNHVILKGADGAQHALTVTEMQPEIKGVVIVSGRAGEPAVREKLTNAVRTAFNLSSAKVCVTEAG